MNSLRVQKILLHAYKSGSKAWQRIFYIRSFIVWTETLVVWTDELRCMGREAEAVYKVRQVQRDCRMEDGWANERDVEQTQGKGKANVLQYTV